MGEKNSLRRDVTNDNKILNKLCEIMLKLRRFFNSLFSSLHCCYKMNTTTMTQRESS